ncbi:MAG TPA: hypothetical protein VFP70_09560 [Burkholderiales bacterium]|nr:hypothetical protein [Burkholderiales bacterium]
MKQAELDAIEALYACGKLEAEAERIAGLQTRLARTLALAEIVEKRMPGNSWIHGHCVRLWATRIADLLTREERREALAEIPVAQASLVEAQVRELFDARKAQQIPDVSPGPQGTGGHGV